MKKIKILHLITHLGVGGAQENTFLTVKGHRRDRFIVHLAAGTEETRWQDRGRAYADAFFSIPNMVRAVRPYADYRAYRQIYDLMRSEHYDVVHTHCAKAGILGRIAARRAGVPAIVHTCHTLAWKVAQNRSPRAVAARLSALKRWMYVQVERHAASLSDALVAVCETNRKEAASFGVAPPEKFVTIYSGIDLTSFNRIRDTDGVRVRFGLQRGNPLIATIGRLSDQKAPLDFVAASRSVLSRIPDARFLLVGDGPLAEQVRQAIADEPRIRMLGHCENVPDILSVLDVFALSSHWEGLGRALTEAMIMEIPIAATDVDGIPELISHGETGLLSPVGDPERLAENIIWLLQNRPDAARMAKNANQRVVPAFCADHMVRRIEDMYEGLLAQKVIPQRKTEETKANPITAG